MVRAAVPVDMRRKDGFAGAGQQLPVLVGDHCGKGRGGIALTTAAGPFRSGNAAILGQVKADGHNIGICQSLLAREGSQFIQFGRESRPRTVLIHI